MDFVSLCVHGFLILLIIAAMVMFLAYVQDKKIEKELVEKTAEQDAKLVDEFNKAHGEVL